MGGWGIGGSGSHHTWPRRRGRCKCDGLCEEPIWRGGRGGLARVPPGGRPEACRDGANTQTLVIPLLLIIFTESLWYPPLLDPVRGDSREVSFKREKKQLCPCLTTVLLYSETRPPHSSTPPSASRPQPRSTDKQKKNKTKEKNCPALEDWQSAPAPGNLFGKPARLRLQYPEGSALLPCWIVHHRDCF